MTTVDPHAAATPLRRPPVHAFTLVCSGVDHTFDVFVRTIGVWWPVQPFSAGGGRVRNVTVEQVVGGRVFETWDDGTTVDWGEVLAWEPPTRFAMTWCGTPAVTEVELGFSELGPSLTRVTVEHRGWDALTDEQLAQDCALPGGYSAGAYDIGWSQILERFAAAVNGERKQAVPEITDEYMRDMLAKTATYTAMLLKAGPNFDSSDSPAIIWEHGRRNFSLRAEGVLAIVCPIADDSPWTGIGIFNATEEQTRRIMDDDPGVRAGVFTYELHPIRSFPGDRLP